MKVPRNLLLTIRLRCLQDGRSLQAFVEEAIREALGVQTARDPRKR